MIALVYLACVTVALVVLAVALRHRPAPAPRPTPTTPAPVLVGQAGDGVAELRVILAAAHQIAARLEAAA